VAVVPEFGGNEELGAGNARFLDGCSDHWLCAVN
jgi:hypothetical protein